MFLVREETQAETEVRGGPQLGFTRRSALFELHARPDGTRVLFLVKFVTRDLTPLLYFTEWTVLFS